MQLINHLKVRYPRVNLLAAVIEESYETILFNIPPVLVEMRTNYVVRLRYSGELVIPL